MQTEGQQQTTAFRYQAPETGENSLLSAAGDVYSWAMTALEVVSGSELGAIGETLEKTDGRCRGTILQVYHAELTVAGDLWKQRHPSARRLRLRSFRQVSGTLADARSVLER